MSSENVIHCSQDVHVKELVKRLSWSVKIRWYYIGISSLLILFVYFLADVHALNLRYDFLIIANLFLFFCNLLYQYQLRYSYDKCLGTFDLRYYLILQIISDYLALTLVVYTLGSIETPIILMIIPNTILATLFFTPRQSLLIALSGLMMVISPLMLELFQLIPVVSIFDQSLNSSFKAIVLSQPIVLFGYVFILFAGVIFCWYLLCSITCRLIQNELELERSYRNMIKLDEEKTHATLRSTHELKAPLAAIKNYVYTMNAGYAGEINDKALNIIDRIGKRCDYLLNNVMDIIKLGNLKSYVLFDAHGDATGGAQFYPVNLSLYMEKFISQNRLLSREKQLTINMDDQLSDNNSDTDKYIMANKENLQLIFINVLSNAINYSHTNGIIDVVLSERNSKNKNLENSRLRARSFDQKQLCVSINDQGIGIDEKQIEKIFEEHFRANNAVKFYEGGTGLGLSIVKVCTQILDAEVQIKSHLGQGTRVTICFKAGETAHE